MKNDTMLVIGNGGSARLLAKRGFDQIPEHIDTFGMGLAYRYFEYIDWWPTYYACCDMKVVHSNRADFTRLLTTDRVTCEQFFFPLKLHPAEKLTSIPHSSTGDFCVRESIRQGYKHILYIGMDRDYQEVIPEARPLTESEMESLGYASLLEATDPQKVGRELLIIELDPLVNTNYFFDSYQRKGDVYSLPKAGISHQKAWDKLFAEVDSGEVSVWDLSPFNKDSRQGVNIDDVMSLGYAELEQHLTRQSIKKRPKLDSIRKWWANTSNETDSRLAS